MLADIGWFTYSIASVIFLGVSMVFYKLPSFKNYSPFLSTFYTNLIAATFAVVAVGLFSEDRALSVSFYGLLWGVLFAATMILQKITLKTIETNALFPVTTSVSNVAVIFTGALFLSESISLFQALGIVLIISSVYAFSRKKEDFPLNRNVALLAGGIVLASTLSKYVQKIGAVNEDLLNFMVWMYVGASLLALVAAFVFESGTLHELKSSKKYLRGAGLIGIFSFMGGWAILKALSLAPLSVVYAIHPSYVVVTAVLGAIIFKENLTFRKIVLILLTVAGVILIKIGAQI